MDISLNIGDYLFNYRVSAIIRNNNKILLHHNIGKGHYTLPGGRVKSGESSITALQREIKEEMGFDTEYVRPISLIENFFHANSDYHEILITHELRLVDKNLYKLPRYEAIEEAKKGKLEFIWMDIDDLSEEILLPKSMYKVIKENKDEFVHLVNDER